MKSVRRTDGAPRRRGRMIYRSARNWEVLPQCERPFAAELRATERCRVTTELMVGISRWRRIALLPRLWSLRRASLARRIGDSNARRRAWSLLWTALKAPRIKA